MTAPSAVLGHALRDRYTLLRELGRGGMATVYLARDLKHDRLVAIKVPRPELAAALGPERFLREIRLAAQLQHPHILGLIDSGTFEYQPGHSGPYYVMPYVEGESLRDRMRRESQLPLDDSLRIAREIALALDYAHRHGVIHRDIKPENILLSDTQALIADFGVARALEAAAGDRLTETGIAVGTPAYLSPEQAAGGRELDGRADIYSLGCVLYEMLAGEPPFIGPTPQSIIAKRFSEPVPHLRTVRDVPEGIEQAVTKALARSPADRFATGAQFASALEGHVGEQVTLRRPTEARARGRRSKWIGLGVLTGLAALGAGLWRSRGPPERVLDANLLAIAPFDVLDPSLQIWHEGLVDILSRNLDGAGPLRTVAQSVGLKRWQGRADRVSAEGFGHRTGAGLVVFGSVRRARDTVSLRATVLDLARNKVEPDLEVKGDTADIGDLTDSLGVRILQVLGRDRPIGSVRQVWIRSRSLPALKAFLYGEQFYRRGLWDSALVYYDQAIGQDSTFALAFRRMGYVLGWGPRSSQSYRPGEEYARWSVTLNHGLPAKDSLLIAADSLNIAASDATDPAELIRFSYGTLSTLEEAARRYPEDPEVWYQLGEARAHSGPRVGGVPAPALEAFDRAIALDPGFAPAYEHTVNLAIRLNRPDLALKYADAYLRLDPTDVNAPGIRLAAPMLDPARSYAPETARMIDSADPFELIAALNHLGWWADSGEAALRILRSLARRKGSGNWTDTLMFHQFLAGGLAYRGHLHEAYAADRTLLLDQTASPWTNFEDPFRALAVLRVIPESVSARTFGHALEPGTAWHISQNWTDRQMRGLPWWLARRDTVSLARFALRAQQQARAQASARGKLQARYLHAAATAYLALARADSVRALRLFQAIPDTLCIVNDCFYEKLIEARLLTSQGQPRQAGVVLDRWVWTGETALFVIGTLERGRIAEGLGERQKARDSYQFVVDAWRHADAKLQPYVGEARAGIARLSGEGGQ
jgi:tRNA A-37 threonylcarbamoyl transferase component Bud32/tetratricopeptide (TPR) repeat protein